MIRATEFGRKLIKFLRLLRTPVFRRGLTHGVAAAIEHRAVLATLPPLADVVDVGANKGQFSLLVRQFHPGAVIHAFEPLPSAQAAFTRLFADDRGVHLHPVAAGTASGEADFHVSGRPDCSSLKAIDDGQARFAPGSQWRETVKVRVAPLDEALPPGTLGHPALLKIDVQGAEIDVLRGAGRLLSEVDHLLIEVSFVPLYKDQSDAQDVIRLLDRHGFHLAGTGRPVIDDRGRCIQVDLLFTARAG